MNDAITEIMYQWAGVQNVDPESRGDTIDARKLEFLEHLFGEAFLSPWFGPTPYYLAEPYLEKSFHIALENIKAGLLIQSGAAMLFDNPVYYDQVAGTLAGDFSLSEAAIDDLTTFAPSPGSANVAFWLAVTDFVQATAGLGNLGGTELGWLDDAITSTDISLDLDAVLDLYNAVNPGSSVSPTTGDDDLGGSAGADVIDGLAGNDIILGGADNDVLYGNSGNDELQGGTGDDVIHGDDGDDLIYGGSVGVSGGDGDNILEGGAGNDTIVGGDGADTIRGGGGGNTLSDGGGNTTYVFGGGHDLIQDSGGTDYVTLPPGITLGDLTIARTASSDTESDDLMILIDGGAEGSIQILGQFYFSGMYTVETLVFDDTSTLDLTTLTGYETLLTPDADSFSGSGRTDDIIVRGSGGGDSITTGSGDDVLDGGDGNDTLYGGSGDDTYIASAGLDQISDSDGRETLVIGGSYDLSDLVFSRGYNGYGGYDMLVTIPGLGQVKLIDQLYAPSSGIDYIHFNANNTTVSLFSVAIRHVGTAGADTISGAEGHVDANEVIDGRGGDDYLAGDTGNDTYIFRAGDGSDTLVESPGQGTDTIQYLDMNLADVRLWTDNVGSLHIENRNNAADHLFVSGATTVNGESTVGEYFERIVFANSSVLSLTGGLPLEGTTGADTLYGTAYNDTLLGLAGSDLIYGNGGADSIFGGANDDYLYGGDDNDVIDGGAGDDTITGDAGNDTASYLNAASAISVNLATATAQNTGGAGTDTLATIENLIGSAYNDTLTGDGSANVIEGGAGNDAINGAGGTDTVSYAGAGSAVTVNLATATAQNTVGAGTDTLTSMENLLASAYNDTITGSSGNNVIDGGAGNDTLDGSGGTDTVSYASASAAVTASLALGSAQNTIGAGTDTLSNFENLTGSSFGDVLTGSAGNNTIAGGDGDDIVEGGAGNDIMTGGNGIDTVSFANAGSATTFNLGTTASQNTVSSGSDTVSGFENILGSIYNDTLTGNSSANVIEGGAGNDTLDGSGGTDTVTYLHAASAVTFNLATTSAQNTGGAGTDTVSNFENVTGSAYNDTLTGSSGNNVIEGGAGNDTIDAAGGTDTASYANAGSGVTVSLANGSAQNTGGAGTDTLSNFESLTGSGFADTLTGSTGNNTITGGDGNDTIYGNSGTDTLRGGNGNDTLSGQAGTDTLYGESGADIFAFEVASAFANQDTIADFSIGDGDALDIAALLVGWNPTQSAIDDFVTFTTSGANTTVSVDRDGTAGTYSVQAIASLSNITGLDADDLLSHGQLLAA